MINLIVVSILITMLLSPFLINQKVASILASILSLLIILLNSLETLPKFLRFIFEWLGNRSYSIYLVHMPVIYIIDRLFKRFINVAENELIQSIISFVVLIFLGALSYSKIENRFRSIGKKIIEMSKVMPWQSLLVLSYHSLFYFHSV